MGIIRCQQYRKTAPVAIIGRITQRLILLYKVISHKKGRRRSRIAQLQGQYLPINPHTVLLSHLMTKTIRRKTRNHQEVSPNPRRSIVSQSLAPIKLMKPPTQVNPIPTPNPTTNALLESPPPSNPTPLPQ